MFERVFERLEQLDIKMSDKFDEVVEKIHKLDIQVAINTQLTGKNCQEITRNGDILTENTLNLAEHMRRTELLEKQTDVNRQDINKMEVRIEIIEDITKDKTTIKKFFKDWAVLIAKFLGAVAVGFGAAYTIIQMISLLKGWGVL